MRTLFAAILALILIVTAPAGWAQSYPDRPITLIVPSTPGSAPDVLARITAQKLSAQMGQQLWR